MSAEKPVIEPEMIPYGMKAALVCLDAGAWRDACAGYFKREGYYLIDEPDDATAAAKLRLNALDVVVADPGKTEAMAEMNARPGLRRRESALFLIGDFKSLDSWSAFSTGADWVLAAGDTGRADEFLSEALKRHEASREPWKLAEK